MPGGPQSPSLHAPASAPIQPVPTLGVSQLPNVGVLDPTPTQALAEVIQPVAGGTALTLAGTTAAAAVQARLAQIRGLFAEAAPADREVLARSLVLPHGVPERLRHDDPALQALLAQMSSECWMAWKAHNGDFEIMLAVVRAMFEKLQACRVEYPDYQLSAASVAILHLLCDVPDEVIPHAERTQLLRVLATRLPQAMLDPMLDEPLAQVAHLPLSAARALLALRRELHADRAPTSTASRADDAQTVQMLGRLRDPTDESPERLHEAVEHVARVGSVEALPLLRDVRTVVEAWSVPWYLRGPLQRLNQRTQLLDAIDTSLIALTSARELLDQQVLAPAVRARPPAVAVGASAASLRPAEEIAFGAVDATGAPVFPTLVRLPDGELHRKVNPEDPRWTIADPAVTVVISGVFMSSTAISNAMWTKYLREMKQKDKRRLPKGLRDPRQPVVDVTWDDALTYCRWLTRVLRGAGYCVTIQIPSGEEWEYAARAGRETEELYATASGMLDVSQAHFGQGDGHLIAVDSASIPPIEFVDPTTGAVARLYQMAGNVWEWTRSIWVADASELSVRGGSSVDNNACVFRASYRRRFPRSNREGVGFRVIALQDSKKSE